MNRLKGTICYLAGPMDEVPDMGKDWRLVTSDMVWALEAGVLNPCDKPTDFAQEDDKTLQGLKTQKELAKMLMGQGDEVGARLVLDSVSEVMRKIVAIDLRMDDITHFTISNVDKDYHMCGSYSEMTHAALQRKPVIVHCKQGID